MHSSLVRIQNTFGFFTTVAFVVAAFIAATDLLASRAPSGTIKVTNTQVVRGRPHYYSSKKEEYAIVKFSLDADLSSLFTWNTKQVFVYVTAEWNHTSPFSSSSSSTPSTNQAVIWDTIITTPSSDHLANLGPATRKKLAKSAAGKTVDPSRGRLSLVNQRPKYQITHPSGHMAETSDLVLRLHYNVQPWVGALTWNLDSFDLARWRRMEGGRSNKFVLPAIKKKDEEATKKRKAPV